MTQREAVETLFSLLPKMEKDTPENVFTKYASEKRMAPALLERLGQVFNTASTNVTLQKDRNGRPTLIDVPSMVGNYITSTGHAPKKASESFLSNEVPTLEKAASAPSDFTFSRGNVPDVWNGGRRGIEHQKVAKAPPAPDVRAAGRDAILLVDLALEEFGNKTADFHGSIDEIAKAFTKDKEVTLTKLATLVADLPGFLNGKAETGIVIDSLQERLKKAGINLEVKDGAKRSVEPSVLFRDRTGQVSKAAAAIENFKSACVARLSINDGMDFLHTHEAELRKDPALDRRLDKLAKQVEFQGLALGLFKEGSAEKAPADPYLTGMADASKKFDKALGNEKTLSRDLQPGSAAIQGLRMGAYGAVQGVEGARRLALEEIPGMIKEFTTQGELGAMLKDTATENRNDVAGYKMDREQIERDTRAAAMLQKLMIKDEILSTKDPEQVWQAFKSIRNASPHVAHDETMLKLLLRQATEIGGLDIDTGGAIRKYDDPKTRPGSRIYDKPQVPST